LDISTQPVAVDVYRLNFYSMRILQMATPTSALWDLLEAIKIQALLSLVNPWLCWFPVSRKWTDSRVPWTITTTFVNRCVSKRM